MNLNKLTMLLSLIISGSFATAQIPQSGLIGYWSFDGHAKDSTSNKNDGVVYGASLTKGKDGKANTAYQFDGTNDYIRVPVNKTINPKTFTINLWAKYPKDKRMAFINNSYSTSGEYGVQIGVWDNVKVHSSLGAGSNDHVMGHHTYRDLSDDKWHMLTIIYDSTENTQFKFFIDGCFYGENNVATGANDFTSKDTVSHYGYDWYIGVLGQYIKTSTSVPRYYEGVLDEVTMHNRALTNLEVKMMFNPDVVTYDTIQINDTTRFSVYDTTFVTQHDTTIVYVNDTTFHTYYDTLSIYDTSYINTYDTIDIYDTSKVVIYDTTRVQVYDTFYVSVTDTLYIDLDRNSGNQTLTCSVKLYPNPTDDVLYIEGGSDCQSAGYSVRVVDAVGKLIYSSSIGIGVKSFSLDKFTTTGIYYVDIRDVRGQLVDRRKIMIY